MSEEFSDFLLLANGVKHITSAPYHSATNGLAERAVQIVKKGLKKTTEGTIQTRVARVFCMYRITPPSTTEVSPAELLLKQQPWICKNLVWGKELQTSSYGRRTTMTILHALGDFRFGDQILSQELWPRTVLTSFQSH